MGPALAEAALCFWGRRRRWAILLAAAGLSSYGAYTVYHLPSVTSKRRKILKFFGALVSVAEAVSSSADAVRILSSDLNRFLLSDSDDIPPSLKQVSKIARSEEFSASVSRVFESLAVGIIRGFQSASDSPGSKQSGSGLADRLLEKMLSNEGSGFASAVVGSFARNTVTAYFSCAAATESSSSDTARWINLICGSDKCRELIADIIHGFVGTAVTVYLDKTMDINTYDELFSGLTNPRHELQVKNVLVSLCNGAVETLVKTSHEVLTSSNSDSSIHIEKYVSQVCSLEARANGKESGGWIERVSSVLAVPTHKSLVLDVTGRVTFESVRSLLEFLLSKIQEGMKRGANVVQEEVVQRGLDVLRYLSVKAMLALSLCLALCMHFVNGPRILMAF
ncbi:Protein PHLOEM PROTEIN 2-LIKE A10 [Platanthera guangdongensis]|uniref:Protein PHLOEM PROTEIN 2-LIKE A10 n=1 Tax=Platanthera guangdongensis TaxID=2320717 RepID=A0ABR2M5A0_9ASPA